MVFRVISVVFRVISVVIRFVRNIKVISVIKLDSSEWLQNNVRVTPLVRIV